MKHRLLICLLAFACLSPTLSCRQDKEEGDVMSEAKFVRVLSDIYLTDALLKQDRRTSQQWANGLKDIYFQDLAYQSILDRHRITEADFYATVAYYGTKSHQMVTILNQVEARLQACNDDIDRREAEEKAELERLEFEKRWKTVSIDESYAMLWGRFLELRDSCVRVWNVGDTIPKPLSDSTYSASSVYFGLLSDMEEVLADIREAVRLYDAVMATNSAILDSAEADSLRIGSVEVDSAAVDSMKAVRDSVCEIPSRRSPSPSRRSETRFRADLVEMPESAIVE